MALACDPRRLGEQHGAARKIRAAGGAMQRWQVVFASVGVSQKFPSVTSMPSWSCWYTRWTGRPGRPDRPGLTPTLDPDPDPTWPETVLEKKEISFFPIYIFDKFKFLCIHIVFA